MKSLLMLMFGLLLTFEVNADAGLVAWNNIIIGEIFAEPSGAFYYQLELFQNEEATDHTDMLFDYNYPNCSIAFGSVAVDEGSEWFFVHHGDEISNVALNSGVYTPFNQQGVPVLVPDTEFYLAGHTTWDLGGGQDVFGWAGFRQTPSGLVMFDNAAAYDAQSLTAGTYDFTPVPEPSSIALLLLGVLTLIGVKKTNNICCH